MKELIICFLELMKVKMMCSPIAKKSLENINWDNYHAVIISDYCKGFIDEDTIKYISEQHPITFLDTKKQIDNYAKNITFIKINDVEYRYSADFLDKEYLDKLIITRGPNGAEYEGSSISCKKS